MQEGTSGSAPTTSPPPRVLVNIATYNERENIGRLIAEIHQHVPYAHVLIVDDNSPDGTGRLVDDLAAKDDRVHALHRAGKLGLGTAIIAGMRYAMERDYDLFVNMDADFSHPPSAIPALIAGMQTKDAMIGSRYVAGGGTANWPLSRRMISKSVNTLVRLMFRMQVRDASGGLRCYRVAKLRQTDLDAMISRGYSFQQEMLYRYFLAGSQLGESPILFNNRKFGNSKVNLKESVRSLATIVYIGLRSLFGVDKRSAQRKRDEHLPVAHAADRNLTTAR